MKAEPRGRCIDAAVQYDTCRPKYGVKTMAPVPTSGMLIGAFAAAVGVAIETVRYYERRGLLQTSVAERGRGDDMLRRRCAD